MRNKEILWTPAIISTFGGDLAVYLNKDFGKKCLENTLDEAEALHFTKNVWQNFFVLSNKTIEMPSTFLSMYGSSILPKVIHVRPGDGFWLEADFATVESSNKEVPFTYYSHNSDTAQDTCVLLAAFQGWFNVACAVLDW